MRLIARFCSCQPPEPLNRFIDVLQIISTKEAQIRVYDRDDSIFIVISDSDRLYFYKPLFFHLRENGGHFYRSRASLEPLVGSSRNRRMATSIRRKIGVPRASCKTVGRGVLGTCMG